MNKEEKENEKYYKNYSKARDTIYKLIDECGMEETLQALADTMTSIMEDDAVDSIKQSLEIEKELIAEEKKEAEKDAIQG